MPLEAPPAHYAPPSGFYFPMNFPVTQEFVQQPPQQPQLMPVHMGPVQSVEGKPRSQAIPILPPSVTVGRGRGGE